MQHRPDDLVALGLASDSLAQVMASGLASTEEPLSSGLVSIEDAEPTRQKPPQNEGANRESQQPPNKGGTVPTEDAEPTPKKPPQNKGANRESQQPPNKGGAEPNSNKRGAGPKAKAATRKQPKMPSPAKLQASIADDKGYAAGKKQRLFTCAANASGGPSTP